MAAPRLGEQFVERARAAGFALAGICRATPSEREAELRRWLAEGRHGSMGWLAENVDLRVDPRRLLPGALSMLVVADQHASRNAPPEPRGPRLGRVARYARGDDYHRLLKRRLHAIADELRAEHPAEAFRVFVDTAPVLEREHAVRAGLGWIGKHTLLIHPRRGSYLLLGGILMTLDVEPPRAQRAIADHCGTCTRCIDACPTGAITPHSVDARLCISYLTIERRLPIDPALHEAMGDWVFGCDVCQEVCPHNSPRPGRLGAPSASPLHEPRRGAFDLLAMLGWTEEERRAAVRGSSMKRAKLDMLRRNAVIAAGNALGTRDDPALRARLAEIAASPDEPAMVRDAATAVVARLTR